MLRIGMNAVSSSVYDFVQLNKGSATVVCSDPQIYKYPMMRKLFYDTPILTDYVMWFDDDSFIKTSDVTGWLNSVEEQMRDCDMLGSVYTIRYGSDQAAWVRSQPWYAGKPVEDKPRFATGGWWCIKASVLKKFDWPVQQIKHCGGDVALGILLAQHNLKLKHFNSGVAINANHEGKESSAERRGASKVEVPVGKGFFTKRPPETGLRS